MFSNRLPATWVALAWVFSAAGQSARAAEDPPVAALEALVEEALRRNPDILGAQAVLDAARERPTQAGALDDPMLGIVYTNDGWTPSLGREDMTTLAVMGSQAFPYPGKRDLRRRVAAADADLATAELERVRRITKDGSRKDVATVAVSSGARSSGFPRMVRSSRQVILAWRDAAEPPRVQTAILEIGSRGRQ